MKGNEAFAESCLRAGCRFFSGYPITPQTEILEYMSWRMEQVGGQFIQTESELAGVNMLFGAACCGARALTTSAGPGFSLKQEGISYLCGNDIPAVIADVMRIGSGLGDIFQGQGDYWQLTRGDGKAVARKDRDAEPLEDRGRRAREASEAMRDGSGARDRERGRDLAPRREERSK